GALERGRPHLPDALDALQLLLHRSNEQPLGILGRDALVLHVDVDDRDVDVRFRLLGNPDIGGEAGDQQQHQQSDGGARARDYGIDQAQEADSAASGTGFTCWPGRTNSCPTVISVILSGRPSTQIPSGRSARISSGWNCTRLPGPTDLMPSRPRSSRLSSEGDRKCAWISGAGSVTSLVMPSRIFPSALGISTSTRKVRVAGSATAATNWIVPFRRRPSTSEAVAAAPTFSKATSRSDTAPTTSTGSRSTTLPMSSPILT